MTMKFEFRQVMFAITITFLALIALAGVIAASLSRMMNTPDTININTAKDQAVSWWVNQQRLTPNKHAVEMHSADAWRATDCYNRNGTWRIYRVGNQEFHFLCRDDDGSIRDTIWNRRTNKSREFDMVNAFTPQEYGIEKDVLRWLSRKQAQQASVPHDIILFIDGVAP